MQFLTRGNMNNRGIPGPRGKSAFQIAVEFNGFKGTPIEWLKSLIGKKLLIQRGNTSIQYKYENDIDWNDLITLEELKGEPGSSGYVPKKNIDYFDGKDGKDGTLSFTDLTLSQTNSLKGIDGKDGINGINGKNGIDGKDGIQGLKGDKGDTGTSGVKGDIGSQGPKGDKGDTGNTGLQGVKGDTGLQGPAGAKGDQGDQGLQGTQGLKGDKGDVGERGLQGLQGIQGPQGDQGIQGLTGNNGTPGSPGAKGDVGNTGPQGPAGADSIVAGPQGPKGDIGNQGIQGIQGIQGTQGPAGSNGTNGTSMFGIAVQALTSSPTDAQTIYFGTLPKAPVTVAATSKIYIRKTCTLKVAEIYCYSGTAGTNESWSIYVRKNNTTDTLIATLGVSASERVFSNAALSVSLVAGDYLEIKSVNPTWATNPLTCIFGGYLYFE